MDNILLKKIYFSYNNIQWYELTDTYIILAFLLAKTFFEINTNYIYPYLCPSNTIICNTFLLFPISHDINTFIMMCDNSIKTTLFIKIL